MKLKEFYLVTGGVYVVRDSDSQDNLYHSMYDKSHKLNDLMDFPVSFAYSEMSEDRKTSYIVIEVDRSDGWDRWECEPSRDDWDEES